MKKFFILFAAVAMMATTACNEKPAKGNDDANDVADKGKTEEVQKANPNDPKVALDVKKVEPTEDGKDHKIAEFDTKDYHVRLENLADGSISLKLWKPGADTSGKPDQEVKTKKCVMQKDNYLMKDDKGIVYVIKTTPGSEEVTIMDNKNINYHGANGK